MRPPSASSVKPAQAQAKHAGAPLRAASASPHHQFPVLPDKSTALLLSVLQQLDQSQWWEAERLHRQQRLQLTTLLEFVRGALPFYRQRLSEAGVANGKELRLAAWEQVPILTRQQLQANVQALKVRKPPAGHRQLGLAETSGSTGTPIRVATTETTRLFWNAFVLRDHYWHRRDFGASLGAIRHFGAGVDAAYPHGITLPDWGSPVNLLHASGPGVALDIHTDPRQQLEWLARTDPGYLITFPSNAAALARLSLAQGMRLPGLREVRLVSEAVDEDLRATVQAAWGVPVVDSYSAQEAGPLALQCPEHPHYHVQSENVLLEVVDAQGRACGPGRPAGC